ncbi:bacterio-opsin activator domain-containing protein [Halomontanus rarus]|uniref:bacterio-opsin activator domain-containing protein n=1 Tax=Halomontanus rarus TaxID=3034020 RepID=UPI0023E77109|nr:bacterio-opsin activator domain-containing protein [Halovivax sp. TS33]
MNNRAVATTGDASRVLVVGTSSWAADATSALADVFPGPSILLASTTAEALERLENADIDCLVCDLRLEASDADASFDPLLEAVRTVDPRTPIVALVDPDTAGRALESGATDVVTPGEPDAVVVTRVQNAIERARLRERVEGRDGSERSPEPHAGDENRSPASQVADERYRSILDHSSTSVLVLDGDGSVRYASPAVESAFGHTPEELERTDPLTLVHPDDRETALEDFAALATAPLGSTRESTYRLKRTDGSWRVSDVTFTNRLTDPTVEGVVVTVTDAAPRSLPDPIEGLSAPFFALGPDWELTDANAAARRLFVGSRVGRADGSKGKGKGVGESEGDEDREWDPDGDVRGTVVWTLLPDSVRETFYERLHEAVRTGSVVEFDVEYPHLETGFTVDVHPHETSASGTEIADTDAPDADEPDTDALDSADTTDTPHAHAGVSVYAREIDPDPAATRTQRDRGRSFEAVVDSLSDGVFVLAADGRTIDLANAALSEFAGSEPLVGRDLEAVVDPAIADRIRERADSPVVRRSDPIETTLERHGDPCPVGISVAPMARAGDDRVVCVVRDETDRRRSLAAMSSLRETAAGLTRATTRTEVCQTVVDAALEGADATVGCVYLADDDAFRPAAFATPDRLAGDLPVIDRTETLLEELLERDGPAVRSSQDFEGLLSRLGVRGDHVMIVPLDGSGILILTAASPFSDHAVAFADSLAAVGAVALARVDSESTVRERDRELERTTAALESLTELTDRRQQIERALVEAETRAEIETRVCDELAEIDWLAFAWIGDASTATDLVSSLARAGDDDGYLDSVRVELGAETGGGTVEPTGRTVATREPTHVERIVSSVQGRVREREWERGRERKQGRKRPPERDHGPNRDHPPEPASSAGSDSKPEWRHEALERGFQSVLSVPLVYDDYVYGALSLYATRPSAFDEPARSIFAELGETVAYAINAVETKQALLTDSVTQLEFAMRDSGDLLSSIARRLEARLTLETVVPRSAAGDRSTVFVTVSDSTPEAVRNAAAECDAVESTQLITERDGELLFEIVAADSTLATTLADHGAVLRSIDADDDRTRFVAELPRGTDVRSFVDMLEQKYPGTELLARRERDRGARTREDFQSALEERLTDRQLRALETAYYSGFFEWPRERTGEEVAHSLGVSQPTFNRHFRTAERKLFTLLFDDV